MAENNSGKVFGIVGIVFGVAGVGAALYLLLKPKSASAATTTGLTPAQVSKITSTTTANQLAQGNTSSDLIAKAVQAALAKAAKDGGGITFGGGGGSGSGGGSSAPKGSSSSTSKPPSASSSDSRDYSLQYLGDGQYMDTNGTVYDDQGKVLGYSYDGGQSIETKTGTYDIETGELISDPLLDSCTVPDWAVGGVDNSGGGGVPSDSEEYYTSGGGFGGNYDEYGIPYDLYGTTGGDGVPSDSSYDPYAYDPNSYDPSYDQGYDYYNPFGEG